MAAVWRKDKEVKVDAGLFWIAVCQARNWERWKLHVACMAVRFGVGVKGGYVVVVRLGCWTFCRTKRKTLSSRVYKLFRACSMLVKLGTVAETVSCLREEKSETGLPCTVSWRSRRLNRFIREVSIC